MSSTRKKIKSITSKMLILADREMAMGMAVGERVCSIDTDG